MDWIYQVSDIAQPAPGRLPFNVSPLEWLFGDKGIPPPPHNLPCSPQAEGLLKDMGKSILASSLFLLSCEKVMLRLASPLVALMLLRISITEASSSLEIALSVAKLVIGSLLESFSRASIAFPVSETEDVEVACYTFPMDQVKFQHLLTAGARDFSIVAHHFITTKWMFS